MAATQYIYLEAHAQYELWDSGVCSKEVIYMFVVGCVPGLVGKFNIGIFSDTVNVINVKLCIAVLHIEHYLCITLSVTFTFYQGHSSVEQFLLLEHGTLAV